MLKKSTASAIALVLLLALAQPVAAVPQEQEHSWKNWINELIVDVLGPIFDLREDASLEIEARSSTTEESAPTDSEEEPPPAFWPGYDPVGKDSGSSEQAVSADDEGGPSIWPDIEPVG